MLVVQRVEGMFLRDTAYFFLKLPSDVHITFPLLKKKTTKNKQCFAIRVL